MVVVGGHVVVAVKVVVVVAAAAATAAVMAHVWSVVCPWDQTVHAQTAERGGRVMMLSGTAKQVTNTRNSAHTCAQALSSADDNRATPAFESQAIQSRRIIPLHSTYATFTRVRTNREGAARACGATLAHVPHGPGSHARRCVLEHHPGPTLQGDDGGFFTHCTVTVPTTAEIEGDQTAGE